MESIILAKVAGTFICIAVSLIMLAIPLDDYFWEKTKYKFRLFDLAIWCVFIGVANLAAFGIVSIWTA